MSVQINLSCYCTHLNSSSPFSGEIFSETSQVGIWTSVYKSTAQEDTLFVNVTPAGLRKYVVIFNVYVMHQYSCTLSLSETTKVKKKLNRGFNLSAPLSDIYLSRSRYPKLLGRILENTVTIVFFWRMGRNISVQLASKRSFPKCELESYWCFEFMEWKQLKNRQFCHARVRT